MAVVSTAAAPAAVTAPAAGWCDVPAVVDLVLERMLDRLGGDDDIRCRARVLCAPDDRGVWYDGGEWIARVGADAAGRDARHALRVVTTAVAAQLAAAAQEARDTAAAACAAKLPAVPVPTHGDDVMQCCICLDDAADSGCGHAGDWAVLPCGHRMHRGCVARWLRRSGNCPMCRRACC